MGRLDPPGPPGLVIRGLTTAVRFLTVVPVPGRSLEGPKGLGRAAAWFPPVGLALGVILWAEHRLLSLVFPPGLTPLLVLVTWKILTGGIHLDGLADSLDGLAGKDRGERLAVMRDGRIGVFGALGLFAVLGLDWGALAALPSERQWRALLLAPLVGRLAPLLLARLFAPATPREGSGARFMEGVTRLDLGLGLGLVAVASGLVLGPWGVVAAAVGLLPAWLAARFFARRLGGLTGDVLGLGVELGELGVLLALAALQHVRVL